MAVPMLTREQRWSCPNCAVVDITCQPDPHTQFHPCAGLAGLDAPMVLDGTHAKVETVDRGDYVGSDLVQRDGDGRPVMSIVTTRDDGQDCVVLAPCARGSRDG